MVLFISDCINAEQIGKTKEMSCFKCLHSSWSSSGKTGSWKIWSSVPAASTRLSIPEQNIKSQVSLRYKRINESYVKALSYLMILGLS